MQIKLSVLCVLLSAATAHAAPAWCGKTNPHANLGVSSALGNDAGDALVGIYMTSCFPSGDDAQHAAEIEAARRTWSNRLGLTDADWADVADFAEADLGSRRGGSISPRSDDRDKPWSAMSPIDQFVAIGWHQVNSDFVDPAYMADAFGPHLSEAGRVAYVRECLSEEEPIAWAMCAPDIAALDVNKLAAELRSDRERPGFDRIMVRLVFDHVRAVLPQRADAIKQLIAKDSAYQKLFTIASEQRTLWTGRWRDRADLVALVAAMDDANITHSRKASAGCSEKSEAAFTAALAALPAKAFALAHASKQDIDDDLAGRIAGVIVADPDGYLSSMALVMCADRKRDALRSTLGWALDGWPGYRGPRTSAASAMLTAGIELDDRTAKLRVPAFPRPWLRGHHPDRVGEAVVESLKDTTITYTRKPETLVIPTGCAPTNRITQIRPDGTLVYEERCTGSRTASVDRSFQPATVDARYTTAVKRGALVAVGKGIVWAVWPSTKATLPSTILGVAVK